MTKTPADVEAELGAMTPAQRKTFEDRVRRAAKRQGYVLAKSRARDPMSRTYDGYILFEEGRARSASTSVIGWSKSDGPGYEASLSMVAAHVLRVTTAQERGQ
jgi:hypothetical protein